MRRSAYLHVCTYITCIQCLWKPEKGPDPLKPEIQMVWAAVWMLRSSGRASGSLKPSLQPSYKPRCLYDLLLKQDYRQRGLQEFSTGPPSCSILRMLAPVSFRDPWGSARGNFLCSTWLFHAGKVNPFLWPIQLGVRWGLCCSVASFHFRYDYWCYQLQMPEQMFSSSPVAQSKGEF